jgi:hypothetical protein
MNLGMMQTRAIKGLPSTVLIALWTCAQPMPVKELIFWTDSNDDDVRKACGLLERLGYIDADVRERGEKFFRIADSAQMLLPGFAQVLPAPVEQIPGTGKSEPGIVDVVDAQELTADSGVLGAENGQKGAKSAPGSGKSDSGTGSIRLIDDESFLSKKENHHQSEPLPKLETVFDALPILFGEGNDLSSADVPADISPRLALAWIAKVYQDWRRKNSQVHNPIGIIRARLKAHAPRKLHLEALPDDFLEEIGIQLAREAAPHTLAFEIGSVSAETEELEENQVTELNSLEIAQAWSEVLRQLREADEMPRASYESWVHGSFPVAWDERAGMLEVAAKNSYARNWMSERLTSQVAGLLAGMLKREVIIRFVTEE